MTRKMYVSKSTDKLKDIRVFISDSLEGLFHGEEKDLTILAVDEVCANLIVHCSQESIQDDIQVIIDINHKLGQVSFEIYDKGNDFDYSNYKEPTLEEIVAQKRKGGLGLLLVRRVMDEVEFLNKNGKSICRLVKNFKSSLQGHQ